MNIRTQKFIAALAASGKTVVFSSADYGCTNHVPNHMLEIPIN